MERAKKLLEVFNDYLNANAYYEIFWSRLNAQYFAITIEKEPAVFFKNYEELRLYVVKEFLYDIMFMDKYRAEYKDNGISYNVVTAFKEKMKPYVEKLPELEAVMEEVIESESDH